MHEVFLSHASEDANVATVTCQALEAAGIRVWIAPRDVLPGQPYARCLAEAVESCTLMVIIVSKHSNESDHVARELELAANERKLLLPFKIDGEPLSKEFKYYLSREHWIDAITPPLEPHLQRLVEAVRRHLRPRGDGPLPPTPEQLDSPERSPPARVPPNESVTSVMSPSRSPSSSSAAKVATAVKGPRKKQSRPQTAGQGVPRRQPIENALATTSRTACVGQSASTGRSLAATSAADIRAAGVWLLQIAHRLLAAIDRRPPVLYSLPILATGVIYSLPWVLDLWGVTRALIVAPGLSYFVWVLFFTRWLRRAGLRLWPALVTALVIGFVALVLTSIALLWLDEANIHNWGSTGNFPSSGSI